MAGTTLQYCGYSFFLDPGRRLTSEELFVDHFGQFPGLEWFHDDFVRLQKDSVHSALHIRVAADQQRKRIRLGVPHGGNQSKTITGVRHVQVGDKYVETLCDDKF